MDGAGLGEGGASTGAFDAVTSALDAPIADAAVGAEADGANDGSKAATDSERADVQPDVPIVGSGGTGGSFFDASSGAAGRGGSGGATGGRGGTGGLDAGNGKDGDAAGGSGTGGRGTGGSGTGGSGTGGSGTGGSGTGGSGTGGGGGNACSGYVGRDAGTGITEGQVAYYRCESASGTELPDDSSSHAHPGTLHTGAGGAAGYGFDDGQVFNALYLSGAQQGYVTLPVELLASACEATIATWVWVNSSQNRQRIFDFGQDTNVYMFLTPGYDTSNLPRFAITTGGNQVEQHLDSNTSLPTGSWQHVAVVLGPGGGFLYLNGIPVASDPAMTLRPADLGNPASFYIGRSQFTADPYFDGRIDSFRIYDRALSADEIVAVRDYTGTGG
jgi:hypothetical protein